MEALTVLRGHTDKVQCMTVAGLEGNSLLVSGSNDLSLKVLVGRIFHAIVCAVCTYEYNNQGCTIFPSEEGCCYDAFFQVVINCKASLWH